MLSFLVTACDTVDCIYKNTLCPVQKKVLLRRRFTPSAEIIADLTRIIIENLQLQVLHYQAIAHTCEGTTLASVSY